MGTVPGNEDRTVGYIERAGQGIRVVEEATSETMYGRRGGGLYPLVLLLLCAGLVLLGYPLASLAPLLLLALWVGGSGR